MNTIRHLVWYEMLHAAYWEQFLSQYIAVKTDWRNFYSITILVLSTVGAASFCVWKLAEGWEYLSFILLVLMAITQLLSVCQKVTVMSDETANKIRSLRVQYIEYYNKLESLYIDIYDGKIENPDEAKERYFQIRETVYSIESLKDSLNIKQLKKPSRKGEYEALVRISRKFNTPLPPKPLGLIGRGISKIKTVFRPQSQLKEDPK